MRGFSAPETRTVTLTRGDESIEFTVHPLPAGWWAALASAFPEPVLYVNGKESENKAARAEYQDLFGFLQLAKHLEPSGVLDTPLPPMNGTRAQLESAARAIRDEFRAAHLTDGEIGTLVRAGIALNRGSEVLARLGKSPSSSPPSPES